MRKMKSEMELREIAREISARPLTICLGFSGEEKRKPSKKQMELAYNVIYGTLLGLNWGESTRSNSTSEQAIIDSAEFTYDLILGTTLPEGESVNGYLGLYCPIKEVLRNWETV